MRGLYVVFEGSDGSGKSTTMKAVADELPIRLGKSMTIQLTNHPGSTPLGAHIRKLVKYPEQIDPTIQIDSLSRQILYMVDTVNFIKQRLQPAMANGETVFADRSSFISALVYGTAEGLKLDEISKLFQLITPPKMDRLYILQCPWQVGKERLRNRPIELDHFDKKPSEFFRKIEETYERLLTGSSERAILINKSVNPQNVVHIDATAPLAKIVDIIVADLVDLYNELIASSTEN